MIRQPAVRRAPRAAFGIQKGVSMGLATDPHWTAGAASMQAAVSDFNEPWWFNYSHSAQGIVSPAGCQFVPTFFEPSEVTESNIQAALAETPQNGWWIFGNESDQEGYTVAGMAAAWVTLTSHPDVVAKGIQFCGPAPTATTGPSGTSQWFADWIAAIPNPPMVFARHLYSDSTSFLLNQIALYRSVYQFNSYWNQPYRIWLTEFATNTDLGLAANEAFMETIYRSLIGRALNVDRIAWWFGGPKSLSALKSYRAEYNDDGSVTALGTYWKSLSPTNP